MNKDLLCKLACPYCGGSLELEPLQEDRWEVDYGILRCPCFQYPIIEGIPVLRQVAPRVGSAVREVVGRLRGGEPREALQSALKLTYQGVPPFGVLQGLCGTIEKFGQRGWARLERRRLNRRLLTPHCTDYAQALRQFRPGSYGQYFFHRYANPSFLTAVATMLLLESVNPPDSAAQPLRERYVLDLACGTGHSSFVMKRLFPRLSVIAADFDFMGLYLARRFIMPEVPCLCIDAEAPLPFPDDLFEVCFCLDAFHYIRTKKSLLAELDRVVRHEGLFLFPHLHNVLSENLSRGLAMTPEDYLRCFERFSPRLFSEPQILRRAIAEDAVDLGRTEPMHELEKQGDLWLAACRDERFWRRHEGLSQRLCLDHSTLKLNPVYRKKIQKDRVRLDVAWPSQRFKAECSHLMDYLPAGHTLDRSQWDALSLGQESPADVLAVRELAKSFVLVHLPESYS